MSESKLFLHGKPVTNFVENREHVSPVRSYIAVLGALFVLTGLTYAVSYADLGPASLSVAMFVAVIKATLVAMYFMHLRYDDRYHAFVFVSSLLFVAIFFAFTLLDIGSRDLINEEQGNFVRRQDGGWNDGEYVKHPRTPPPAVEDAAVPAADPAPSH